MGAKALIAVVVVVATAVLWSGTALAGRPSEPPGKSGDAPGHQKDAAEPAALQPQAPPVPEVAPPVVEEQKEKPENPAKPTPEAKPERPKGKAKDHRAEAAAPAKTHAREPSHEPPPASVSAPGASGPHKVTICHKGHAITVDVHAARAHVEGHGDTYAPAGAKGRAACARSTSSPPTKSAPSPTPVEALVTAAGAAPRQPEPAAVRSPERTVAEPVPPPAAKRTPATPVTHATLGQRATFESALPFTGRSLATAVLAALALMAAGGLLRLKTRT